MDLVTDRESKLSTNVSIKVIFMSYSPSLDIRLVRLFSCSETLSLAGRIAEFIKYSVDICKGADY